MSLEKADHQIMTNQRYGQLIDLIPYGLERAVLRIMSFHTGKSNAVGRFELVEAAIKMGFDTHERQVRKCIHDLRRKGHLICSTPGESGGYFLSTTLDEFREFIDREIHSKAIDLLETEKVLKEAARLKFGEASQPSLLEMP